MDSMDFRDSLFTPVLSYLDYREPWPVRVSAGAQCLLKLHVDGF